MTACFLAGSIAADWPHWVDCLPSSPAVIGQQLPAVSGRHFHVGHRASEAIIVDGSAVKPRVRQRYDGADMISNHVEIKLWV